MSFKYKVDEKKISWQNFRISFQNLIYDILNHVVLCQQYNVDNFNRALFQRFK